MTLGTNLAELKREARALVAQLSDERPPRGERQPGFTPVLNGLSRLVGEVKTRAELNALLDVVFDRAMTTTKTAAPPRRVPFAPTPSPPRRPPPLAPLLRPTAGVRAPDREASVPALEESKGGADGTPPRGDARASKPIAFKSLLQSRCLRG